MARAALACAALLLAPFASGAGEPDPAAPGALVRAEAAAWRGGGGDGMGGPTPRPHLERIVTQRK